MEEKQALDGRQKMSRKEARAALKEHHNKVSNGDVSSFVSLQNINKVYPNGVQAVYDFNLDIKQHEFIVLVGPSGCGKSTTLSMVAGLNEITSGYLYIDKILSNYLPAKDRDISMVFQSYALYPQMSVYDNIAFPLQVRRYKRPEVDFAYRGAKEAIKAVEDPSTLLPAIVESYSKVYNKGKPVDYLASKLHLSNQGAKFLLKGKFSTLEELNAKKASLVEKWGKIVDKEEERIAKKGHHLDDKGTVLDQNNAVVHVLRHLDKGEIRERVFDAAKMLDLGPYLDRRPKELSGGQMQRVALGRAIVRDAKLFLMDEPLSNLDAKLRVQMRSEIVRLHEAIGATTIYVTHDQTEAMTMANRIVVMSKGWVQQVGEPQEVYSHPKNLFVATFIGSPAMNIFEGIYEQGVVRFPDGYSVDLGKDFAAKHDAFYQAKIADCERMLKLCDDHVEVACQKLYHELKALHPVTKEAALEKLNAIQKLLETLDKPSKGRDLDAVKQALSFVNEEKDGRFSKKTHHALVVLERCLNDVETVSNADLGKIHSAQAFNESREKKAPETLSYGKPTNETWLSKLKKKHEEKAALQNAGVIVADPKGYVESLLKDYQDALKGAHPIKIGIRPEHIHLDSEYTNPNKTKAFAFTTGLVELLGNELLVHGSWNGTDVIAKISTGTLVKAHSEVMMSLNGEKLHVFDIHSGDTLL